MQRFGALVNLFTCLASALFPALRWHFLAELNVGCIITIFGVPCTYDVAQGEMDDMVMFEV